MHLKKSLTTLLTLFTLSLFLASCSGRGEITDPTSFTASPGVTTVNLAWTPVSDVTGYTLERQEGSGAFKAIVNGQNKTTHSDTGLKPNTRYTYRIKAVKGSSQSAGKTTTATTKGEGNPLTISALTPVWLSKQPVNFASVTQGQEISTVKAAPANVTVSGSTITMNGRGEAMYYLGGLCTRVTTSTSGTGFRVVGDDKQLPESSGGFDLVGKQFVSFVYEGTGAATWDNVTVFCERTPTLSNNDAYTKGRWGDEFAWGTGAGTPTYPYGIIVPTHAANLPDGTIATWAAWKETTYGNKPDSNPATPDFINQTAGFLWTPGSGPTPNTASSSFTATNNPTHDMFCAGLSVMPDGDIFAAGGGSLGTTSGIDSQRRTSYFDSVAKTWAEVGSTSNSLPLAVEHWYPTSILLPDSRVFVVGGASGNDPSGESKLSTSGEIRGTTRESPWTRSSSSVTAMFPQSDDINLPNNIAIGSTNANAAEWSEVRGWYPYLHIAPDGQLIQSGPLPRLQKFSVTGTTIQGTAGINAPEGTAQMRTWGNSIMYDEGKILVTGGSIVRGAGATNTGILVDVSGAISAQAAPPMRFRRGNHNSVVLPTGDVLMIGGNNSGKQFTDGSGFTAPKREWDPGAPQGTSTNANYRWATDIDTESVLTPELYSPDKNAWRDLADMTIPRNYHSVGILLKDGRVLAAGGGLCGDLNGRVDSVPCNHPNGQIFEPPYLFNEAGQLANRPVIGSLGSGANTNPDVSGTYDVVAGSRFSVTMNSLGDGTQISKFSLIRLAAVTHSVNTDTRYLEFSTDKGNLTGSGNSYQITLTGTGNVQNIKNVLVPGYYFLFAINDKGVPSVAQVVQVN